MRAQAPWKGPRSDHLLGRPTQGPALREAFVFGMPSIRIGKAFGIPLEVHTSWFLIFALVAFSLSSTVFPSLPSADQAAAWQLALIGTITAALFFASILAHELSHALVAKATGGSVGKITLFLFGGVAQIEEEPTSPGREFLMAAAGPGMSLVISGACYAGYLVATAAGSPWWVWAPLQYLSGINLLVAVFNLLPGFPLDGGRVFRSILWGVTHDILKATRWASQVGQFIGWTMVVWALFGVIGGRTDLIWFGLIGWFIASLAGQAYRQQLLRTQTEKATVAQAMTPDPETVPGEESLDALVHQRLLGGRHTRYPVLYEGSIVGLVTLGDVKSVERDRWPFVRTVDVANRNLDELVVYDDATVASVIPRLAGDRPGALIVARDGRLAGIITRADVLALLEAEPA